MTHQVTIIAGPDAGRKFPVPNEEPLVIGRGSDSDTKIRDPRLSRIHCELRKVDGRYVLLDRGGVGGVNVNGKTITDSMPISVGTVFQIGDTRLRLEMDDSLDAATMAAHPGTDTAGLVKQASKAVESSLRDLVGQTFQERFEIEAIVATSPTSVVFRGTDTKHNRAVAIKVLRPQLASSDVQRERFIRAMKTVMPIKHPNIVRLRMAGRSGPHCWCVTDWVEGKSVSELIDDIGISGMLDWKQVWRVGIDIGSALEEAHRHQVVHRNVTPANLLRRSSDKAFLLSDLIFARALELTDASRLTKPGEVIGDLGYMAPERVTGVDEIDERSDQFGLGATMYTLLTGHPPYPATSLPHLISLLMGARPRPPKSIQFGVDERFSSLVMKMIEVNPKDRYDDSTELLAELKRVGMLSGMKV
ncbi:FHA domain-containing serine/threonine-protein kinase [Aporhodopirellula aestuarii]|uniref:Protein kinase n=1 Tax=Aporhodopirellula aestuarii TaxID=2950107 RepID=A0ABT0U6C7_9BACT|nr:FHA domain-containing serine/threonine-protein kinase [Aporhodopirellula aestuarii]MCM2372396.1 protein kinase [Aporhodopirellula aestuarii]